MEDLARKIDVEKLISYSDDLVEVLKNKKDINNLTQCLDEAQILRSSSQADSTEVQNFLEENQKMINSCKQKIDETKSELVADANLDSLQRELEDELQRERLLQEELSEEVRDLELQRVSIEVRKKIRKNLENDELRAQRKLSMYASVTNIIPNLEYQTEISGHIVEREKRVVEKFEFDLAKTSSLEICNDLWTMINL